MICSRPNKSNYSFETDKKSAEMPAVPITDVFCDLDNFLFVASKYVPLPNHNLERIVDPSYKKIFGYYAINKAAMRLIFPAMKAKGIRIHFNTNATYKGEKIFHDLKKLYDLPEDFFEGSIYLNRNDYAAFSKAAKIV